MIFKKLFGRKNGKKRWWKRLLLVIVLILGILLFYFMTTILPVILLSSTTTTLVIEDDLIFTDDNQYNSPMGPGSGTGEAIELTGGLEAMGVDFTATLVALQEELAAATTDEEKNVIYGKIAYVQLFQLMNAETEMTDHPVLLLGTAMGIREMSLFSGKYSDITAKMYGDDYSLGIYGTWCNRTINGLPNKGGGIISHSMSASSVSSSGERTLPSITFTDLSGGSTQTLDIEQTYADVYITSGKDAGKAKGYNKGAYGPLQIEADHWVTWVCPYVSNQDGYNEYLNTAYINIPITDKRFDSLYSAANSPVNNVAQSIVTADKSHLAYYRNNQTFVDNVMATVGHPNYIQEFANLVNNTVAGQATFGEDTGYYFAGRFTKGQDWEDWVMSLEAWPHAFTCFAVDRIGSYCMFDNPAELKNTKGEVLAAGAFKTKITNKFGEDFTFLNETAEEIYWALEMLQSWNYGAPCTNYGAEYRYKIGYFYRELANYISVYGTADIRAARPDSENCNPRAKCNCGNGSHKVSVYSGLGTSDQTLCTSFAYDTYLNLANLICTANGTRYNEDGTDSEIYKAIHSALYTNQSSSYHKNSYGYAITAILDAEANAQTMMKDLFGLENFSIFNYGGSTAGTSKTPALDSYDYSKEVPASTPVSNAFFEDAAFIGDSLTEGFMTYAGCPADFFCKVGATTTSLLSDNVFATLADGTYSKIYVMIGINEINANSNTFKTNYNALIDAIKAINPTATIYLQSVLPITADKTNTYGQNIDNDQIQVQNNVIRQIAAERKCIYVNVREDFVNEDTTPKEEVFRDGLHLKSESYAIWFNYLKSHTVRAEATATPIAKEEAIE